MILEGEGEDGRKKRERKGRRAESGTRPLHLGGTSEAGLRNMKGAARRKRDKLSSSKRKGARARLLYFKLLFPAELIKMVARHGRRRRIFLFQEREGERKGARIWKMGVEKVS